MKKIVLTALTLMVMAGGALALTGFRHAGHGDPAHMQAFVTHRVEDMLDDVNATDAQRQQILAIKDKVLADVTKARASHASVHQELLAQWNSDTPDAARVHAIIADRSTAMKGIADEVADALIQVHGILTPDQRAKVAKKLQRHAHE